MDLSALVIRPIRIFLNLFISLHLLSLFALLPYTQRIETRSNADISILRKLDLILGDMGFISYRWGFFGRVRNGYWLPFYQLERADKSITSFSHENWRALGFSDEFGKLRSLYWINTAAYLHSPFYARDTAYFFSRTFSSAKNPVIKIKMINQFKPLKVLPGHAPDFSQSNFSDQIMWSYDLPQAAKK